MSCCLFSCFCFKLQLLVLHEMKVIRFLCARSYFQLFIYDLYIETRLICAKGTLISLRAFSFQLSLSRIDRLFARDIITLKEMFYYTDVYMCAAFLSVVYSVIQLYLIDIKVRRGLVIDDNKRVCF